MTTPTFEKVFQYPIKEFKRHLTNSANSRIIFSGKYGIGKTRFLVHFFDEKNQTDILGKNTFVVYRLSPVNYSIAATEDILDYIKYDIIYEFLKKGYQFDEKAINYLKSFPSFLKKHFLDVMKALVYMIPEVGKETVESFEKLEKIKDVFLNETKPGGDQLNDFMENIEKRPGSPYISDIITNIIQKIVNQNDQSSILIIDDLDRLDPEHIFRILNVFSAHFADNHYEDSSNKFGFQKIILVCDFNNIRTLFHHRYGKDADFIGYIDKFYSTDVFHFDNKPAIISILRNVFSSLSLSVSEQERGYAQELLLGDHVVYDIVILLIEKGFLSLRSIIKLWQRESDLIYRELTFSEKVAGIKGYQIPIVMQLKLLVDTVGDYVQLEKAFQEFERTGIVLRGAENIFGFLIVFLSYPDNEYLKTKMKSPFSVDWREQNLMVEFTTRDDRFGTIKVFYRIDGDQADPPEPVDDPQNPVATPKNFWAAMADALLLLRQIRFIK
jgi:KAP family P-loop domain